MSSAIIIIYNSVLLLRDWLSGDMTRAYGLTIVEGNERKDRKKDIQKLSNCLIDIWAKWYYRIIILELLSFDKIRLVYVILLRF